MKITYIGHSGMLVTLENYTLLFDYYEGTLPEISGPLYVFASHNHGDHFNPKILSMNATFILSSDISCASPHTAMAAGDTACIDDLIVTAVPSNDAGVAFHIQTPQGNILHCGDLNDWDWEGEDSSWLSWQHETLVSSLTDLAPLGTDVAMVPADPRLGNACAGGILAVEGMLHPTLIVPMHFSLGGGADQILPILRSLDFSDKIKTLEKNGENLIWNKQCS